MFCPDSLFFFHVVFNLFDIGSPGNIPNLPCMVNSLWISSADLLLLEWIMVSMTS